MRIFLTGSASCLGMALLPVLCDDPSVEAITGIDVKNTQFKHPKLKSEILDIRDEKLSEMMVDHDAVIHLAFVVKRGGRTFEEMHDVNVRGSSLVVDAANKHGIKKLINLSSVSVYGTGENIVEEAKLNPSPTFHYAQHKAELEQYINEHFPTAVQFRSHLIIGANAQDFLREMFASPFWLKFGERKTPKQQVVHEKDVVSAILLALTKNVSGTFNLSAPEVMDLGGTYIKKGVEEGRKIRKLPFSMVRFLVFFAKYIKPQDEFTWIEILDTSVTVNCAKAKRFLGWEPKHSAWQARKDAMSTLGH